MPRTPHVRPFALLMLLALTSFASLAHAAWSHDPATVGVDVTPNPQAEALSPDASIADGAGGVFVPIVRAAVSGNDIVVQHLGPTGAPASGWPAAGITVATGTGTRTTPRLVLDGAGGVFAVWMDTRGTSKYDVYGQHLNAAGVRQWVANGLQLNPADAINRGSVVACADAAGGFFIAYRYDFTVGTDTDIYAAHVNGAGAYSTLTISSSTGNQLFPVIVADNAGGAYIAFEDDLGSGGVGDEVRLSHLNAASALTFGNFDVSGNLGGNQTAPVMISDGGTGVYMAWLDDHVAGLRSTAAERVDINGSPHIGWGSTGTTVHSASATTDLSPSLALDNSGGLFIALVSYSGGSYAGVLAHRTPTGVPYSSFGTNGLVISSSAYATHTAMIPDGSGGVLVELDDVRTSYEEPAIVRIAGNGAFAPLSVYGGRVAAYQQCYNQSIVADPAGGAFLLWSDYRTGNIRNYVAHVDNYGVLGEASPTSAGVKDIPADQGGAVRITWNSSWMDGDPDWGIGSYWIWRQAPLTLANAAVRSGAAAWADGESATDAAALVRARSEGGAPVRLFQHDAASASAYAWEFLSAQNANGSSKYSYVASTTTDSIGGHNPYTVFMVEAHSALDSRAFWQTTPDSGYSVDNLPPVVPAPFTATRASGVTNLHWNRNSDADLAGYRLYRGTSLGFVPGPATLISGQQDSGYADVTGSAYVYKLTAIDVHGNESPVAIAQPTGTLAVDDTARHALAFALASGNPARGGASLRFALPSASHVRIALYDAAGREVRVLADGAFDAGTFTRAWNGADATGAAAPSGLYFARLATEGRVLTTRFVLTR